MSLGLDSAAVRAEANAALRVANAFGDVDAAAVAAPPPHCRAGATSPSDVCEDLPGSPSAPRTRGSWPEDRQMRSPPRVVAPPPPPPARRLIGFAELRHAGMARLCVLIHRIAGAGAGGQERAQP